VFQVYVLEFRTSKDWVVIIKKRSSKSAVSCYATALRCAQIVCVGWLMARG